jgi:hypothetical protein
MFNDLGSWYDWNIHMQMSLKNYVPINIFVHERGNNKTYFVTANPLLMNMGI